MMTESVIEGVVAVLDRGGELLVIRRAAGIAAGGWWCLPGGAIEPGESQPAALVREVREELGLLVQPARRLWTYRSPDEPLVLHWWQVGWDGNELQVRPDPAEVAEVRWATPVQLRRLRPVLQSNLAFLDFLEGGMGETVPTF